MNTYKSGNKYSEPIVRAFCDALAIGATRRFAAQGAGISDQTYLNWMKTKPEFLRAMIDAEDRFLKRNLAVIMRAAVENTDWKAAAWLLERRFPSEYGKKLTINIEELARQRALEQGLDPDEVLVEAQALIAAARMG